MQTSRFTLYLRPSLAALLCWVAAQAHAQITLYENDDYSGRSLQIHEQEADLSREGFNDKVSSVVVRKGNWQLCSDAGFRGQCVTLSKGRYASISAIGINDRISSVRPVDTDSGGGAWGGGSSSVLLYEHGNYGGKAVNSRGSANIENLNLNDKVSSIIIRSGRWEFCTDKDFRGRCVILGPGRYGNLDDMGLNDTLSSFRPSGGQPAYRDGRE
ncbi:beta/gamma crystallin family protein [Roseateles oligotrophus]|uniref:Beta/gamma crystallin family protein n=1 Tax=Roseateles oligotrophus TaxID=1769250 RepID=A0ABT2YKI0_9BURK|nr:beta/gamma crystallin family protein [Roseateles oligotrophus]MCV2370512.1 beta/gamma crystallin family protein [Roseateles oligotrophus]